MKLFQTVRREILESVYEKYVFIGMSVSYVREMKWS